MVRRCREGRDRAQPDLAPVYLTPVVGNALGYSSSSEGSHLYSVLIHCTSPILLRWQPAQMEACLSNFGHCQACRGAWKQRRQSQTPNLARIAFASLFEKNSGVNFLVMFPFLSSSQPVRNDNQLMHLIEASQHDWEDLIWTSADDVL